MNKSEGNAPLAIDRIVTTLDIVAPPELDLFNPLPRLQMGDRSANVSKVLVCTTVSTGTIDRAIAEGAGLLICQEPLFTEPLESVTYDDPIGTRLTRLIQGGIALFALGTSAQAVRGGLDDTTAAALGIMGTEPILPIPADRYKFVVFVPTEHCESVRQSICRAGAGAIGDYTDCTFRTSGTGTFTPQAGADPFIGSKEQFEEVAEQRLESIVPAHRLQAVVTAMLDAHPYEEPAYDAYPLHDPRPSEGLGRMGQLESEPGFDAFVQTVKTFFSISQVECVGTPPTKVSRTAYITADASFLLEDILAAEVDVLVTGSLDPKDRQAISGSGLCAILAGFHETQRGFSGFVADALGRTLPNLPVLTDYTDPSPSTTL